MTSLEGDRSGAFESTLGGGGSSYVEGTGGKVRGVVKGGASDITLVSDIRGSFLFLARGISRSIYTYVLNERNEGIW